MNPKDVVGKTKPPLALIPPAAVLECCKALQRGVKEYGAFNWREQPVEFMEYLNAFQRHFMSVVDGEDIDPTSLIQHLGHMMATCAIVIDAQACGTLIDNRPKPGPAAELIRAAIKPVESPNASDASDDSRSVVGSGNGPAGKPGGAMVGRHALGQPHDSDR